MNTWKCQKLNEYVHRITWTIDSLSEPVWILLQSDEHFDNAHCERRLLKSHHEEAVCKNAPILKAGDVFCAMQGRWDKRADQSQLRPEHRGNNYLDLLQDTALELYEPYKKNIAIIAPGNHELSIVDKHQVNLTQKLCEKFGCFYGTYWGFVQLRFKYLRSQTYITKTLFYHHGYGGGGEVTRGLIDNSRTRSGYHADYYFSGHIHRRNMDENILTECDNQGNIEERRQLFLRGSTYKHDDSTWHALTGKAKRPLGGWWLKFTLKKIEELILTAEPIMAI